MAGLAKSSQARLPFLNFFYFAAVKETIDKTRLLWYNTIVTNNTAQLLKKDGDYGTSKAKLLWQLMYGNV